MTGRLRGALEVTSQAFQHSRPRLECLQQPIADRALRAGRAGARQTGRGTSGTRSRALPTCGVVPSRACQPPHPGLLACLTPALVLPVISASAARDEHCLSALPIRLEGTENPAAPVLIKGGADQVT